MPPAPMALTIWTGPGASRLPGACDADCNAAHRNGYPLLADTWMAVNPTGEMLGLLSGYWYSQVLYVIAELGIPDALAGGPKSAPALAEETRSHAGTLYRFLRAAASAGILREDDSQQFSQTPLSATLRSDRPDSLRPLARLGGHPLHWQAWGSLLHSVRTGETAFDAVHGRSFFLELAADRELAATFHGVLDRLDHVDRDVVDALDLGGGERVVDVGGGSGGLARRIGAAFPNASMILFDRAHVPASTQAGARVDRVSGDFLEGVPHGGDAYVLKFVLHDWDDTRATRILENCRSAMLPHGRLFVVETLLPDDQAPSIAKTHDVNMLVLTGGRERRLDEYRSLFSAAGFELVAAKFTPQGVGISGRANNASKISRRHDGYVRRRE